MEGKDPLRTARDIPLKDIKINSGFWSGYIDLVLDKVIPYQWDALNDRVADAAPSHAIRNIRIAAGLEEGEFHGMVFQDSDVAKWLEAVGYSLAVRPDERLEQLADEVIDLLEKAQQPDGYLNTYYTIKEPGKRWTNLWECHELYCAGHLIEAGVAYYGSTGKDRLLKIVCRLADHIDSVFGPEEGKLRGYPGHQEIELALVKLYRMTGEQRYLRLAKFFIDERGREPYYFDIEYEKRGGR
ncbi:MAG TPA: glycoside hydrolase family 127 protein, partial [Candidatus Atribacteria bacterium]|nr:glycoside hydrolase family 127 protein [Candidatus Atribacteria bacterium]